MKKVCNDCGLPKELSEFHRCKRKKDGHAGDCKKCSLAKHKEYNKNPEVKRRAGERSREYRINNKAKVAIKQREHRLTEKGREMHRIQGAKDRLKNPRNHKARSVISAAIKLGKIEKQPCALCGSVDNIEAHHPNYDKPLDVQWLCSFHHRELHVKIREVKRDKETNDFFDDQRIH